MQFYNGFDFIPNPAAKLKAIFFFIMFTMYGWLGCFSIWTIDGAAIAFYVKLTILAFSHQMNWRLGNLLSNVSKIIIIFRYSALLYRFFI